MMITTTNSSIRMFCRIAAAAIWIVAVHGFDLDAVAMSALRWEQKQALPIADTSAVGVHHPITFANATHGFVLGGSTQTSTYTKMFYLYEASTDTWTDLTTSTSSSYAFPGPSRSYGYAVVSQLDCGNSKAYIGFGASATNYLKDLWEFDMSTGGWRELASLPGNGRLHPAMNYIEALGQIHVGLGNGNGGNYNDWWSYSIATDSWTQLSNFPSLARHHPYYFVIGTDSYVGFGHSGYGIERDWYKYDTISEQWARSTDFVSYLIGSPASSSSSSSSPSTTEARVAGTQFSITKSNNNNCSNNNNKDAATATTTLGFVLSGDGSNHGSMSEGEFHVYDPNPSSSRNWRQLPSHPGVSRWAPGSFVLQGTTTVYLVGGYDKASGTYRSDLWSIDVQALFGSSSNSMDGCRAKKEKFSYEDCADLSNGECTAEVLCVLNPKTEVCTHVCDNSETKKTCKKQTLKGKKICKFVN